MTDTAKTNTAVRRPRRMAREPQIVGSKSATGVAEPGNGAKVTSKASLVLELLQRPEGAILDDLVAATGWLPHTTRAALTGLRKKGHAITSDKAADGPRIYRVSKPCEAGL